MPIIKTGNATHDANMLAAEEIRQVAYAAAGNNMAAVKAADIAWATTGRTSALANGVDPALFNSMLRELGQYA